MQKNDPPNADSIVAQFFAQERQVIGQDSSLRRVDRISLLGNRYEPPVAIEVHSDLFQNGNRKSYFEIVCARISRLKMPSVVFADPDVGIAIGKPSSKHITSGELNYVWSSLKPSSVLVVFQYKQHMKDWVGASKGRLAASLGIDVKDVADSTYPWVTFVSAKKIPN